MTASDLQSFKESLIAAMPALAVECVTRTRDALRHSSTDLAMAQDRAQVFLVAETLLKHSRHFEACLTKELQAQLGGTGRRSDAESKPAEWRLDDVGLVDEHQAETEILLAQIVQMIDLRADWELREMDAYMATLMQLPDGAPREHFLQPARFAAALSASLSTLGLGPEERRLLLRLAGVVLADLLKNLYANACASLQRAGVKPQPYRAKVQRVQPTETAAAPAPAAAASLQTLLHKFPPAAALTATVPGAPPAPAPPSGLSITFKSIDLEPRDPSFLRPTQPATDDQIQAMMAALFQQLDADAQVPPGVRALISQLQPSLQKAARSDPSLLASTRHPAWRFINELAQHASGYAQTDAKMLQRLIAHTQPVVTELNRSASLGRGDFDAASRGLQRFVEERSHQEWQHQAGALSSLQSADHRLTLEPVVRQQLVARLVGVTMDAKLREFLLGTWVQVLTHVLSDSQAGEARAQGLLNTVEDLIHCLKAPTNAAERASLRATLPALVQRLREGMGRIAVPAPQQQALLERLTLVLGPHLSGGPATAREQSAPITRPAAPQDDPWSRADDDEGGYGALPSLGIDTNIGALPTVPMALGEADSFAHGPADADDGGRHVSPADWAADLQVGAWCKLSLQGQWVTAQLLWISNHREFLVFKRSHALQLQSISRKALERLRAEGLATQLDERKLVQRAVDSLLLQVV
ncbi:MAG: DUF1631 family protein [Rubrivivax sp.]